MDAEVFAPVLHGVLDQPHRFRKGFQGVIPLADFKNRDLAPRMQVRNERLIESSKLHPSIPSV
jgi:hypothetical protein